MGECLRCGNLCEKKYCSHECSKFINDELSPFRRFVDRARRNCKGKNRDFDRADLKPEELKAIYDKQNGKCPYTGWQLIIYKNMRSKLPLTIDRASLDRIDSKKLYTIDNVQFLSYMAQLAKNIFSEEELLRFCKAVAKNRNLL